MPAPRPDTLLVAVALMGAPLTAQQPTLIADLNQTPLAQPLSSNPRPLARLGGEVLLQASTPFHGAELWAMDLTTRDVRLVADIVSGPNGSLPLGDAVLGGSLFFAATDATGQRELWRSDGTAAGTARVLDLAGFTSSSPRDLRVVNGRLVFVAHGGSTVGTELFVSDGTAAGTQVVDIYPGGATSDPASLFVHGGYVYFAATRVVEGRALWRTDGTVAGTQLVMDPAPGSQVDGPVAITSFNGQLLFGGGGKLWLSDGTAAGSVAIETTSVNTVAATTSRICYVSGLDVFATDGTPGAAQQILTLPTYSVPARPMLAFGQRFMLNIAGFLGSPSTWFSDGTVAGTFQSPVIAENDLAVLGNRVYFNGNDYAGAGQRLWSSDGTVGGATLVGNAIDPEALLAIPGTNEMLFGSQTSNPWVGRELWSSDGTVAGTTLVADIADESQWSQDGNPVGFVDAAGTLYFVARTGTAQKIWRSDGTAAGTVALGDAIDSNQARPVAVGTRVYYLGYDDANGGEIWVTDGTPAGTHLVRDIYPGSGSSNPNYLVAADDLVYFTAWNGGLRGLWRTDGTLAGTIPLSPSGTIGRIEPLGRGVVFTLWPFAGPMGLYYSDGTQAGTVRLTDLETNSAGAQTEHLQRVGDRVFATGFFSDRLFVTDGTVAGTFDLSATMAAPPENLRDLIAFKGQLVFQGFLAGSGARLWVSDGTAAGTHEWFVPPGGGSLSGNAHTVMGDLILWNGSDGATTQRLYRTDGTTAGTFPLRDQIAHWIEPVGDHEAWFSSTGPAGVELWRTDGTAAGTTLVADLIPGVTSSFPNWLTQSSGKLFFSAYHPQFGDEPWVVDLDTNHQQVGYSCSSDGTAGPEMFGSDPVLGTTMTLSVYGGPEPGLSLALLDNHTTSMSLIGIGYCARFYDPGAIGWSLEVFQNGFLQHQLPIPNNPALVGLMFRSQALVLGAGGLLELEMSNGVAFEIGY